ncbi:glutathione ABC transporter permease GsiD [Cupriavidus basilensis OR16]|uniref:Glutathione transport system permease protein GsiD n=1 Tax=Cupriavidus basilensis OR16 TaxID=1127483 RepID=H1SBL0_9BURK|nr:ABC transporter permease subunit [Cupriavidus basilensis]EHP40111.1 glutathione ABC transporter permease GsiD [Cupriavidus basilensis OR16]
MTQLSTPANGEPAVPAAAATQEAVRTPWTEFWRKFRKQHLALGAGVFVLLLVAVAVLAPHLVPYDPENFFDYDALNAGPSAAHWFGVDSLGRDIFSRILAGARISLAAGFFSVIIGAIVGTVLGLLAGYYEGWWDRIVMRISDVLFAFPLKRLTYVEAARSIGASDFTILMRHILPGTISSIVVYFSMRIGTSIITAASLSFLGLGAQPPTPEWGAMLNEARADMVTAPHVAIFPSLAIFLTVLAFNLLGDGLRDALDPKIDRR